MFYLYGELVLAIDEATMAALVTNHRSHEVTIIDLKKLSTSI